MNRIAKRFESVILHLDEVFREAISTSDPVKRKVLLSYVVLKLHDQWNYRSRQIVCCSYGRSEGKMMKKLRSLWTNRKMMDFRWEPDWHVPSISIRAATLLNVPDLSSIQVSLGSVTYIDDIRWTRNAIAHNIPSSFVKYKATLLNRYRLRNVMPHELLVQPNSTGNSVYEDWCTELSIALNSAL